jgi:copper(I)-binding protein
MWADLERVMTRIVMTVLTAALMMIGAGAQGPRVTASAGWVKAPAAGETQAVACVTVDNPTMYEIYLVSATTEAAGRVELRDAGLAGDAGLQPVEFISVPAYRRIDMEPGGLHLRLIDLKRPLKAGDTVSLTIATDTVGKLEVEAIVRPE